MRSAAPFSLLILTVAFVAGCGGGSSETPQAGGDSTAVASNTTPMPDSGAPTMPSYDTPGSADTSNETTMPTYDDAMNDTSGSAGTEHDGSTDVSNGTIDTGTEHDPTGMMKSYADASMSEHDGSTVGDAAYEAMMRQSNAANEGGSDVSAGTLPNGNSSEGAYTPDYGDSANVATTEGGYPGYAPNGGQRREEPLDFAGKAKRAIAEGRDYDAFQYLFAHILSNDEAASVALRDMKWVPGLRHPALAVRWGVGVNLTVAGDFQGNMYPIGTTQKLAVPQRGRREGDSGYDSSGAVSEYAPGMEGGYGQEGSGKNALISKTTGDFGQKIVEEFQTRLSKGEFGVFLREADEQPARGSGGSYPGSGEGYSPDYAMGGGAPSGGKNSKDGTVQIAPGVTFIGQDNEKKLLAKAKELGHDVLAIFSVAVGKAPRTGYITNTTKVTLYDVNSGKEAYKGDVLNNILVQKAREADKDDPVEKEITDLFAYIDKNYKMVAVPEGLQPEHAIGRVKQLIAVSYDNPLPVLAEIKFYHTRQLLTDDLLAAAYARVVDPQDAATLATGAEEDRKKVLESWLPK